MSEIPIADVQRGDLLLVTQHPTDELAALILDLDRSPGCFSHCGVALGDGTILSAFPHLAEPYVENVLRTDVGGLRVDDLTHFFGEGQAVHRLAVADDVRDRVRARLDPYLRRQPMASFSVEKIVMVAAALHALDPVNVGKIGRAASDRVVRAALAAACAWDPVEEYYCAEFVAEITGWTFTLEELALPTPIAAFEWWRVPAMLAVDVIACLLSRDQTQARQDLLSDLIAEVWRSDPTFFDEGLRAAVRSGLAHLGKLWADDDEEPAARLALVGADGPSMSTTLPHCLVTPRMLAARGIGEPGRVVGSPEIDPSTCRPA